MAEAMRRAVEGGRLAAAPDASRSGLRLASTRPVGVADLSAARLTAGAAGEAGPVD